MHETEFPGSQDSECPPSRMWQPVKPQGLWASSAVDVVMSMQSPGENHRPYFRGFSSSPKIALIFLAAVCIIVTNHELTDSLNPIFV